MLKRLEVYRVEERVELFPNSRPDFEEGFGEPFIGEGVEPCRQGFFDRSDRVEAITLDTQNDRVDDM